MHPLITDVTSLTDEEISSKINEVYAKMRITYNNPMVYRQLQSILQTYQVEQQRRAFDKRNDELDEKIASKIDIGKRR